MPAITQLRSVLDDGLHEVCLPNEDWQFRKGRLHESLGNQYQVCSTSPEQDGIMSGNQLVLQPVALVQVYMRWEKIVDNEIVVDPEPIEQLADDFRAALQDRQDPRTDELWYLQVERIWYPPDPVGQKTRFHALIAGRGDNNAVVLRETGP